MINGLYNVSYVVLSSEGHFTRRVGPTRLNFLARDTRSLSHLMFTSLTSPKACHSTHRSQTLQPSHRPISHLSYATQENQQPSTQPTNPPTNHDHHLTHKSPPSSLHNHHNHHHHHHLIIIISLPPPHPPQHLHQSPNQHPLKMLLPRLRSLFPHPCRAETRNPKDSMEANRGQDRDQSSS